MTPSFYQASVLMNTAVPINERVPLDVFDVVISYLQDVDALRSCALVCGSWNSLTRPYLFRRVVCRPAVPSRTFKNLLAFLSTLPQSGNFLRSVTIDGRTRNRAIPRLELSVEVIAQVLAQLPKIARITARAMRLTFSVPEVGLISYPSPHTSRSIEMLTIQDCTILQGAIPLRRFLSYFGRIDALVIKDVLVDSMEHPAELPSVAVQIRSVFVSAVTASGDVRVLRNLFHGFPFSSSSPLTVSLAPRTGLLERIALNDILSPFKLVSTLSVNVLSLSGSLNWIIEDQRRYPPLRHCDVPKEWASADLSSKFPSIHTLVLYSTTTSSIHRESATLLYAAILANNWRLLSNAPTSLRHIELRFQRYGPHSRDTIEELRAIEELQPSLVRWEAVDAGTLARFPELDSFSCVLCDGGFMEQWGPIEGLSATPPSVFSRQTEFDDYVVFLKDVLPLLQDEGRLHFRMSDV